MARILLVDDEPALCELLATVLELSGHEVSCCNGGFEAIEVLKKSSFDLVLSDVRMPLGDGVDLGSWIRDNSPQLPLLFMTGGTNISVQKNEFLQDWPCLAKPIAHDYLLQTIERCLSHP